MSKVSKLKKLGIMLIVSGMLMSMLTACGGSKTAAADDTKDNNTTAQTDAQDQTDPDENYETGDASLDDPLNQDEIGDTELLVVSFGTSYNDSRRETIGAIEKAMQKAFPDYAVRRGFTSQIIIDKLKERDGLETDNVKEALDRAAADGITELVVQPTHLMDGFEYMDLAKELEEYEESFDQVVLADPLLTSEADFDAVAKAITEVMAEYDDGETAFCYMGHGTEADSNQVYSRLQETLKAAGYTDHFIGTVEAEPSLEDVTASLKEAGGYKRVVLRPLMVVAGDHANNDMAGDDEDSWKSVLNKEGYETECVLEGLGQIPAIRELYVQHTKAAMDSLAR